MHQSLKLTDDWDLTLDGAGNIAVGDSDTSVIQDVASACRTFLGECWYDNSLGMPYWQSILGKYPSGSLVASKLVGQAELIEGVEAATVTALNLSNRAMTGTMAVQVTDGQIYTLSL